MSEKIISVQITDLSRAGSGVARLESGEVVFIPFTAPGDSVRAEILERKKNYAHAQLVEIITPSPDRVQPPCAVFGRCGGCSWQHLPYPLQFQTKKKGVLHALKRSGIQAENTPVDELPAMQPYQYRNRIQLRGEVAGRTLGFYARGGQTVVGIDRCEIADERINSALPRLKEDGFSQFKSDFKVEAGLDESGVLQTAWNQGHAALGFRQVNDAQNALLQKWVATHIRDADTLLDLYGGAGNLSLGLHSRFKTLHCVDVRVPKRQPYPHFHFHRGSTAGWLQKYRDSKPIHSVILDPPREGLAGDFSRISAVLHSIPIASLILVGCDVDAFVRDTHRFIKAGYRLERLGILDLFPQTPHVESLALFTR